MIKNTPRTILDKLWADHTVISSSGGEDLLSVDLNLVHEGGSFLAFDQLKVENRIVRKPAQTLAITDHYLPTRDRSSGFSSISNPDIRRVVEMLDENARMFGIPHIGMLDDAQGIVHVIAPETGLTQPGMLITCCDSHTATQGAMGALAIPIGQSNQLRHVLATQTIWQKKPKIFRIRVEGLLPTNVTAKDVILQMLSQIGIGGAVGYAIEYCGPLIDSLSMESRFTICNMSIEAGARIGLVAPDDKTFQYIFGKSFSPKGGDWDAALKYWRTLPSDTEAHFDRELTLSANSLQPMVSWGTSPEDCAPITARIPDPADFSDRDRRQRVERALDYMRLVPGTPLQGIPIDQVFIGSCTNSRIEDLRTAANVVRGRRTLVPSIVVPGSMAIKRQAEAEGLHQIFLSAGFEWRNAGCSMCGGSNGDMVPAGLRCASTTNRNFEGRQGPGALTHIMSPAMAAAAAVSGHLTDVRIL